MTGSATDDRSATCTALVALVHTLARSPDGPTTCAAVADTLRPVLGTVDVALYLADPARRLLHLAGQANRTGEFVPFGAIDLDLPIPITEAFLTRTPIAVRIGELPSTYPMAAEFAARAGL